MIGFKYTDGGRKAAGFKGTAGDCGVRAIALTSDLSYQEAYDLINKVGKSERNHKRGPGRSTARTGIYKDTFRRIMEELGYTWTPTMFIGKGCTTHLRADELPMGKLICNVSKHYVAVIDKVIHDNHDCSRGGTRCVYGYWHLNKTDQEGNENG